MTTENVKFIPVVNLQHLSFCTHLFSSCNLAENVYDSNITNYAHLVNFSICVFQEPKFVYVRLTALILGKFVNVM